MTQCVGSLVKNSDNTIEFFKAKDIVSGEYVNTATMTVTLYTLDDSLVAGPISGFYIANSDGHYVSIIQDSINWDLDVAYKVVIVIDGGANRKLTQIRTFSLVEFVG